MNQEQVKQILQASEFKVLRELGSPNFLEIECRCNKTLFFDYFKSDVITCDGCQNTANLEQGVAKLVEASKEQAVDLFGSVGSDALFFNYAIDTDKQIALSEIMNKGALIQLETLTAIVEKDHSVFKENGDLDKPKFNKYYRVELKNLEVVRSYFVLKCINDNLLEKNVVIYEIKDRLNISDYFFYFKDGYYHLIDEKEINRAIDAIHYQTADVDLMKKDKWLTAIRNEFDRKFKARPVIDFDKHEKKKILNFKNGLLVSRSYEKGDILVSHTKKYYSRSQINANYIEYKDHFDKPLDACPNFKDALNKWFETPEERFEALKLLYYLLSDPSQSEQIMLLLRGRGGDGKGEFSKLMSYFFHEHNKSAVRLEQLDEGKNNHATYPLFNSRLNVCDETREAGLINEGLLKAITGGATITMNPKNVNQFDYTVHCLFVILSNHALHTNDTSKGFFRRVKALFFQGVPEDQVEKNLFKRKLLPEIEGIIFAIVQIGGKMYKKEGFVETKSDKMAIAEISEQNAIYMFIQDKFLDENGNFEPKFFGGVCDFNLTDLLSEFKEENKNYTMKAFKPAFKNIIERVSGCKNIESIRIKTLGKQSQILRLTEAKPAKAKAIEAPEETIPVAPDIPF